MTDPRIVAVTAQRYEPDWLVDDLRANLAPWVAELIVVDNRGQTGPWAHEGELNARKRQLAQEAGCEWVLFVDPDERIEDRAAHIVPPILAASARHVLYGFPLAEMWTPTGWRTDGQWGRKLPRHRLFRILPGQQYPNKPIHCGVGPLRDRRRKLETLPVRMYHLKNIEPANRVARAQAYLAADPDFRHQRRERADGWDWMYDETGLAVREIEPGRGFSPPYTRPYLFTPPGTEPQATRGTSVTYP